jgi:uncharacterized protein
MTLTTVELAGCLTSSRLHLILMPTEACNFRCVYCYETFQMKRMHPWVVTGVKRLLERRAPGLLRLTLSWFGGEPLLATDVIEDIMKHVAGLRAMLPALSVASDITTNAYLLDHASADRLLDLGITQYQISFDGPREWHDRKRVRPGGRGTFDCIWANLMALRDLERPFRVTVRLHVDRENEAALPGFLDELAAGIGGDGRFELFVRALGRFGGPNDGTLPTFDAEGAREAVRRLGSEAVSRGLRLKPAPQGTAVCYAAHGNSFLIRADGTLNKCTLALEHPGNRVGRLREDGSVEIDQERILPWMRGLHSGSREELGCPMRGLADRDPRAAPSGADSPIPVRAIALAPETLTQSE